jgi:thiol-disulfide isomerase/thioredoxin
LGLIWVPTSNQTAAIYRLVRFFEPGYSILISLFPIMKHQLIRLFMLLTLIGSGTLFAQEAGIRFAHGSVSEVLGQAKAQGKIVFVDAFTTWCGPCKWMSANTFPDASVGEFFNANFVSYKLDMEKGEGIDFAKKYKVNAFPTLLFLASDGELIDVAVGARDVKGLLELGNKVIKGGYETLPSKQAKFNQGVRDRAFLYEYLIALNEAGQNPDEVLAAYKEGMKGEAMLEKENWDIFNRFFQRTTSEQFLYVESHLDQFKAKFGEEVVNQKIVGCYLNQAYGCLQDSNEEGYKAAMNKISGFNDVWSKSMKANLELSHLALNQDWKAYVKQATVMIDEYGRGDAMSLNEFAWTVYEGCTDQKLLKKALAWAETSVQKQPEYANLDTQAMLLYAVGRKQDAITAGNAAIEAAKASGDDYQATQDAMDSWK